MGYVGLPLAVEVARAGIPVVGFEVDREKVDRINSAQSYIGDVPSADLKPLVRSGRLRATLDWDEIRNVDAVSICVPTPLRKTKDPDITYILSAVEKIRPRLRRGHLIILESTTYPGTTEELLADEFQETGLVVGKDFFLAFSPERVDPSNKTWHTKNTPKIVGGVTPACTKKTLAYYGRVFDRVIPVSSAATAEMVKLLENTFRSVNIGLVNEMAIMCDKLGLDVWEVIDAAATKPFGFMPFYPGPGLGGHCIPIDPHYLSWKLKTLDYHARFIELASQINGQMPTYVMAKVNQALNDDRKPVNGSKVLIVGVAYKPNVNDVRESPALDIMRFLDQRGAQIYYHDPHIETLSLAEPLSKPFELFSHELTPEFLRQMDCVIIVTNHKKVDYQMLADHAPLIVDTRNALKGIKRIRARVVKL
ncbi:MAG: nucleotide sugar dehydrogenase [Candidatus Sumerlaeia bacterium]